MRANLPRTALFTKTIERVGLEVKAAGRSKVGRAFGPRRLTIWVVLGFGLAALATVGANNWRARAATNRFVAVGGSDPGNDCSSMGSPCASIQHAVNQSGSGDLIELGPGTYFENVTVNQSLTIQGDSTTGSIVNGSQAGPVFIVGSSITVSLNRLTVTNGTSGAGASFQGGGILNDGGALTIARCTITGNSAGDAGGGIFNNGTATVVDSTISGNSSGVGGGIFNQLGATLNVTNTTISGNAANFFPLSGDGGGIANRTNATVNVANSTISGNSTTVAGGGISNGSGTMTVVNTTITGNSIGPNAGAGGGVFNFVGTMNLVNATISGNTNNSSLGSGIFNLNATLNMTNTISAGNIGGGGDCNNRGGTIATNDHNLIQDGSCSPFLSGDPKLGPLQNNGGPTLTQALLAGSPAVDAGDDSVLGSPLFLSTDQRGPGFPRKSNLHVDIGAFEVQGVVSLPFDTCLKDNTTGNLFQWNSTTGQYKFTRCSDGFMLTGTGVAKLVNGIRTLTDFKTDRRISAGFNTGQLTGNATLYLMVVQGVWQSFQIVDTNPAAVCACPG